MNLRKNFWFYIILAALVFFLQFFLSRTHLLWGFTIDDWRAVQAYKEVVNNPIVDLVKAWRALGPHAFAHTYYNGVLYDLFKTNYIYYQILNTILQSFSVLSLFPAIYLLFKNKWLATLTTLIFAFHFTHFGNLSAVLNGGDSLMIVSMNLFFAFYIWTLQKNRFTFKIMVTLVILLLAASIFDITRFYPVLISLPIFEVLNYWVNKNQRGIKISILRLLIFYSPFIALILFDYNVALNEANFNILTYIFKTGSFEILLTPFASFSSLFIPPNHIVLWGNHSFQSLQAFIFSSLIKMLIIFYPIYLVSGFLMLPKPGKYILRSLFLSLCFSLVAFLFANHWLYLDSKTRSGDPGVYLIPSLYGLFILSGIISFFIEWLNNKRNFFLLALGISPLFSLLFIFMTWIMVCDNCIFMGVHVYISVASIGAVIFLSILFYAALQKLQASHTGFFGKFGALLAIGYFLFFLVVGSQEIDKFFSDQVKNGYGASDQERLLNTFWNEVGRNKHYSDQNPILIYLNNYQDYENGFFYANSFVLKIQSFLTIEGSKITHMARYCNIQIGNDDIKYMRAGIVNGKKVIISNNCGYDIIYPLENFFAFKMINRNLVPDKSEILEELGFDSLKEK